MKTTEHTTLDFHLEMIKKIDRLLAEHEPEDIAVPSFQQPPLIPHQPPSPIEPRSPLGKAFTHEEVTWKLPMDPARTQTQTIPAEFKTELSVTPQFRFITSLEFLQSVTQTQDSSEERVEIIDINAHTGETITSHHTTSFLNIKNRDEKTPVSTLKKEELRKEEYQSKKVEVIDTQALEKETSEDTWITATQQAKQIEKKAKVYFLNKKDDTDKKQKNNASEQSYIPDDIEERLKALKEKKKKEEEQRRLLDEEFEGDLQAEEEKKDESEDTQIKEEKRRKGLLARQEKIEKTEQKNLDGNDPSSHGKDPSLYKTANELKKELKEQKRLHQLAIRKARVEERQRKKEEREALKVQKKQKLPEKEQKPPVESTPTEQDSPNEDREKAEEGEEGEAEEEEVEEDHSDELDEDIRKVLLMTDYLLGELPEDVLNIFLESEEFKLYEKVLSKYKIKIK